MGLLGSSLAFLSACWSLASSTLPLFCSAFICSRKRSSRLAASPLSEVIASPSPRPELFRGGGSCATTASRPGSIVSRPLQQGHVMMKGAMAHTLPENQSARYWARVDSSSRKGVGHGDLHHHVPLLPRPADGRHKDG